MEPIYPWTHEPINLWNYETHEPKNPRIQGTMNLEPREPNDPSREPLHL